MSVCESKLATRPIPYCVGSVGQELVGRDDLWAVTTEELNAIEKIIRRGDEEMARVLANGQQSHDESIEWKDRAEAAESQVAALTASLAEVRKRMGGALGMLRELMEYPSYLTTTQIDKARSILKQEVAAKAAQMEGVCEDREKWKSRAEALEKAILERYIELGHAEDIRRDLIGAKGRAEAAEAKVAELAGKLEARDTDITGLGYDNEAMGR